MTELYWITRLDAINCFAFVILIFAITVLCISAIASIAEYRTQTGKAALKFLKWSVFITIIDALILVLTPTTREALTIYGVGGTIDYLKTNEKARQLPDKCIDAIDKFLDEKTK